MNPEIVTKVEFVDFIPDGLDERTLYVAARYRTVAHLCFCGCGRKVVTPLAPTSWRLTFDGVSISLYPSVGNWNLPCKSHYWIDRNRVKWAGIWTVSRIEAGRAADARARTEYDGDELPKTETELAPPESSLGAPVDASPAVVFWRRLWRRLFG